MDIDSPSRYSTSPGSLESPENPSPHSSSKPTRYHEVASSSKPYPVARLLDQITALQSELEQERQWRADERSDLERRYQADLKKTKDSLEERLSQLQEKHKTDIERLTNKAVELETTWTALEARTSSLKSDVETLRLSLSISQGSATLMDATTQTVVEDRAPVNASRTRFGDRCQKELRSAENTEVAILQPDGQAVITLSEEWLEEKAKLLDRQKALENAVAALQAEAKSLNAFMKQLQDSLNAQRPMTKDRDFELSQLKLRNATSSNLYKEWAQGFKDLETQIQRQSDLVKKAGDAFHSSVGPDTEVPISWANEVETELSTPKPTGAILKAEPAAVAPDSNGEHGPVPLETLVPPESGEPKGHKRTLSDVQADEPGTSTTDAQRRRTGSQSYVSVPRHSWTWKGRLNPTAAEFKPFQRDFSTNWRGQPVFGAPAWQNRSNGSPGEKTSLQYSESSDTDFSTTRDPLDIRPSRGQPTISLPPSPEKGAGPKPKEWVKRQERIGAASAPPLSAIPGTLREVGVPFKAPTPRPKKWQNSVLKKNR